MQLGLHLHEAVALAQNHKSWRWAIAKLLMCVTMSPQQ